MKCNHNLPEEYSQYECKTGEYVVIDSKKKIILKSCSCNQECWTNWQKIYFSVPNNYKPFIKEGLLKSMNKYLN